MKTLWLVFGLGLLALGAGCVSNPPPTSAGKRSQPIVVDAACGQCQWGLKGEGCDLAVRFAGKCYFVDGVSMDQLGDAHAADGMCNAVRSARVTGQIANDRFAATTFELLPKQ